MLTSPLFAWRIGRVSTPVLSPVVRRAAPLLLVLVLAGCGGGKSPTSRQAAKGGCEEATTHTHDRTLSDEHLKLDAAKTYRLVFETNCGDFTVALDQKLAPNVAGSLVSLAKRGFFDDTFFHRIVPGFVIQGGDPTGMGSGGPGYSTHDKVPQDAAYTHGVVAMAKSGAEPAGTAGSQFFVVTGQNVQLTPDYAIVGKVTSGLDVVDRIGRLGNASEQPTRAVVISKVKVATS
jgi:peptidyl-prolyl cis-trans isomerase B (cyclophilin B)